MTIDWSGVVVGLLTALTILASALATYFNVRTREISKKLDDVHTIVNSQREAMTAKIDSLKEEITALKEHARMFMGPQLPPGLPSTPPQVPPTRS